MNLQEVQRFRLPDREQSYSFRDSILYALSLGYGAAPCDPAQLRFVFEANLAAVPSMCVVLAHPGLWVKEPKLGFAWKKLLHGEQSFEIHAPLPAEGVVTGQYRITSVDDKGVDRGAILHFEKHLLDLRRGQHLATVRSAYFLRGDGGQGSFGEAPPALAPLPTRAPDHVVEIATLPQAALLYRLNGDWNPIHADPVIAAQAGFERPILQGLCTLGIAVRALLQTFSPGDPNALTSLSVRFSKPVFPGETIVTEFFEGDGERVQFRARVRERDEIVLDRGTATLRCC